MSDDHKRELHELHLVRQAQKAKLAEYAKFVAELDPGHAHLCPRGHAGWGHCRCICDFEARAALRKLAGLS